MSAIEDYAVRCGRDLDETAKKLNYFNELRDKLKGEFQSQIIEVVVGDFEAINSKIAAEEAILAQRNQKLEMALAALNEKPCASATASTAATGAANSDEKIPLATHQETAYIEEGNQRKGQGMTATYELIEEAEASSERMHERMVLSARRAREAEEKVQVLQSEFADLAFQDPRREDLLKHIELLQLIVQTARENVADGRQVLDADNAFLNHLKDEA